MSATNIPWNKVQVSEYHSFLKKYCNKSIPDESRLRKNFLNECYQDTLASIWNGIQDSYIWIAIDETTDALGRYITNLIVGKLDPETFSKPHLICSRILNKRTMQQLHDLLTMDWKFCGLKVYKQMKCLFCIQILRPICWKLLKHWKFLP